MPYSNLRLVPCMTVRASVCARTRHSCLVILALALALALGACGGGPNKSAGPVPAIYTNSCLPCHGDGLGGAPITGDRTEWERRIAKGITKVRQNAIAGFEGGTGIMPPMGGRPDLSADEITAIVDWMVAASQ